MVALEASVLERASGAQQLLLLLLCIYVTWKVARARQRRALQAADARAAGAAAAAAAAVAATSECFTAEWVNHLLRAVWPTSLEPKIAAKLRTSLDAAFAKILKEGGHKGPLKYVEGIRVERISLGRQPPALRSVRVQSSPAKNTLQLDFGIGFAPAEGFSVVLAVLVRPARMLPAMTAHVEVANLSLTGRCRLALTLAPDKAPGVEGFTVSFTQAPAIDFDFVPFGLPIGELPYVLDLLKDQLQAKLNAKMVEPNRMSITVGQNRAAEQSGQIPKSTEEDSSVPLPTPTANVAAAPTIARRSWVAWRPWGAQEHVVEMSAAEVDIQIGEKQQADEFTPLRTAMQGKDHGREDEGKPLDPMQAFTVFDNGAFMESLRPSDSNEGDSTFKQNVHQHVVRVTAACGTAPPDVPLEAAHANEATIKAIHGTAPLPEVARDRTTVPNGHGPSATEESAGPMGDHRSQSLQGISIKEASIIIVSEDDYIVARQEESEPIRGEGDASLAAVKALSDARASLEALQKRVAAERLRALVEGAPFLVHDASGAKGQFLCYSQSQKALLWADDKVATGEEGTAQALHLGGHCRVTAGTAEFPQQLAGKSPPWRRLWRSSSGITANLPKAPADDARSFSVTSLEGTENLHVELPKRGNGRSRREWMDAISDVIASAATAG